MKGLGLNQAGIARQKEGAQHIREKKRALRRVFLPRDEYQLVGA